MNNSFEELYQKSYPNKELHHKHGLNPNNLYKKEPKCNPMSKNKPNFIPTHSKYPSELYQYSMMSHNSVEKNLNKINTSKSNHKKSKREDTTNKKTKINSFLKKCPTIQLTKKEKDIREAIEYRFEKSKMKIYRFHCTESKLDEFEDLKTRSIIDDEEEEKFAEAYGFLNDLKVVNLYDYHRYKDENIAPKKEKSNNKIIVIKNSKKKRQNSDTIISFNEEMEEEMQPTKPINTKIILNSNNCHYFSNHPMNIQSQRNHTESSVYHHQRNKSESPGHNFKLEFPTSKVFHKQKSGSRSKIKTDHSLGLNEKIITSSSVEKNFKSIKDIYLNAISNLANKNTVKTNHKLFKGENENKNKNSKSVLYDSEKKSHKNEYHSTRPDKNNSSSALQQNYFSCISSRENRKDERTNSSCCRKATKEKLEKTVLINEVNPTQWKSIIMKIEDSNKINSKEIDVQNDNKKFKLKLKDHGFEKISKNLLNSSHSKFLAHPHSYRENIKSPKIKKNLHNEIEEIAMKRRAEKEKLVNSSKNLNSQTYSSLLNSSASSIYQESHSFKKTKK